MKRMLSIFILLLFIPGIVKGNDDETITQIETREYSARKISTGYDRYLTNSSYYLSDQYTYENGVFTLTGDNIINNSPMFSIFATSGDYEYFFLCYSTTSPSCSIMYAIYPKLGSYQDMVFTTVRGESYEYDMIYAYYSDEYEIQENGKYRLVNPVKVINKQMYDKAGKYVCNKLYEYEDCDDMNLVLYSISTGLLVDRLSDRIKVSDSYEFRNGKYYLTEPEEINPTYIGYEGLDVEGKYTCISSDDNCDKLYTLGSSTPMDIHSDLTGHSSTTVTYNTLPEPVSEKMRTVIGESSSISICEEDLVIIENEEIIDVEIIGCEGKIIPKKEGETDVTIISKEDEIRIIHVEVKGAKKPAVNPNTIDLILVALILLIFSGTMFFISKKRFDRQ